MVDVPTGIMVAETTQDEHMNSTARIWLTLDEGRSWVGVAELETLPGEGEIAATALAYRDAQYVALGRLWDGNHAAAAWHGP